MWAVGELTDLDDVTLFQYSLRESCRMGRRIDLMKLICSLGHCECDYHTIHKLSQRRLTADWLAPQESDCSRIHSKVYSDWLPSYIKATRPVPLIFKMAGYFPDSPRMCVCVWCMYVYIYIYICVCMYEDQYLKHIYSRLHVPPGLKTNNLHISITIYLCVTHEPRNK